MRTPTRVRTSIVSVRCGIVGRVTTTSASTGIPASTHVRIARSAVLSAPGCPTSQSCASRRAQWNGTFSRCTPADRSRSTTALVTPAPAVQRPRFSGRSSERSWSSVGRSARRSGSPPPTRKAPGRPATARAARRTSLAGSSSSRRRRTASPRQPGRTANQRDDGGRCPGSRLPGTGPRPRSSLDGVGQWRARVHLVTSVPPGTVSTSAGRFARTFPTGRGGRGAGRVLRPRRPYASDAAGRWNRLIDD